MTPGSGINTSEGSMKISKQMSRDAVSGPVISFLTATMRSAKDYIVDDRPGSVVAAINILSGKEQDYQGNPPPRGREEGGSATREEQRQAWIAQFTLSHGKLREHGEKVLQLAQSLKDSAIRLGVQMPGEAETESFWGWILDRPWKIWVHVWNNFCL